MLTIHQRGHLAFTWEQFYRKYPNHYYYDFESHTFKIIALFLPGDNDITVPLFYIFPWELSPILVHFGLNIVCLIVMQCCVRHYNDVIMSVMASQITSLTATIYSRRRSKATSKLRVTGLCEGNSPVTGEFPAQRASNAENVSIHHGIDRATVGMPLYWGDIPGRAAVAVWGSIMPKL